MDRSSLVFCILAVAVAFAASAIGYRIAALPADVVAAARTPVAPEELPDIDLGEGWGVVSGLDLMGYWLERNPPDLTAVSDTGVGGMSAGAAAASASGGASAVSAAGGEQTGHGGRVAPPRKRFGGC